jgi:hypothetical protein
MTYVLGLDEIISSLWKEEHAKNLVKVKGQTQIDTITKMGQIGILHIFIDKTYDSINFFWGRFLV